MASHSFLWEPFEPLTWLYSLLNLSLFLSILKSPFPLGCKLSLRCMVPLAKPEHHFVCCDGCESPGNLSPLSHAGSKHPWIFPSWVCLNSFRVHILAHCICFHLPFSLFWEQNNSSDPHRGQLPSLCSPSHISFPTQKAILHLACSRHG